MKTLFNQLPNAIVPLEKQRIDDLYALWEREKKAVGVAQTKSFSEFVCRHSNDIFTRNIAKGLHAKICNGNFNNWLGTFRRSSQLSFITKSDIQDMVKDLKNALNIYLKYVFGIHVFKGASKITWRSKPHKNRLSVDLVNSSFY